jgi:hypothetical protein
LSRPCDNGTSLRNSISWQRESLNNPHHRSAVATAGNFDVGFTLDIWAFALGDMRISLQVSHQTLEAKIGQGELKGLRSVAL